MPTSPETLLLPDGAITPLIVNGSDATRIGLDVLLRRQSWVRRCVLAGTLAEGLELARRHRPEVALLDISDSGVPVSSMTKELHASCPSLNIVLTAGCATFLSMPPPRLGAVSFVTSSARADELVATIRAAALSDPAPRVSDPAPPSALLSDREQKLLYLISTGATNREIAVVLHLGPDSVKKSAGTLYRKLGVRNRAEAARRAAELVESAD